MQRPLWFSIFSLLFLFGITQAYGEEFTLTTYYPAPYGVYREMRSQKIAIGDNYYNAGTYAWGSQISKDADLVVEGEVGIGTPKPEHTLDIKSPTNTYIRVSSTGSYFSGIYFGTDNDNDWIIGSDNNAQDQLRFRNLDGDAYDVIVVKQNGDVGIGATNPGAKLEVDGNIIASTPSADNHVATRGWVLAQSGGGCIMTYCSCRKWGKSCGCTPANCPSGFTDKGVNGMWQVGDSAPITGVGMRVYNNARWCCVE